jgi:hypothetical protein
MRLSEAPQKQGENVKATFGTTIRAARMGYHLVKGVVFWLEHMKGLDVQAHYLACQLNIGSQR